MANVLRHITSNPHLREELWRDPRGLITRIATPFPSEIGIVVEREADGQAYFKTTIPRDPSTSVSARQRMKTCPVANVSGDALVADPRAALEPFGIRVPEDVIVFSDPKLIHLWLPIDS